jgi:hypothetical protein
MAQVYARTRRYCRYIQLRSGSRPGRRIHTPDPKGLHLSEPELNGKPRRIIDWRRRSVVRARRGSIVGRSRSIVTWWRVDYRWRGICLASPLTPLMLAPTLFLPLMCPPLMTLPPTIFVKVVGLCRRGGNNPKQGGYRQNHCNYSHDDFCLLSRDVSNSVVIAITGDQCGENRPKTRQVSLPSSQLARRWRKRSGSRVMLDNLS